MKRLSVDNASYKPTIKIGASKMKQFAWFVVNGLVFQSSTLPFSRLKVSLLRLFGAKVGEGVVIKPSVNIKYPWKLEIRNNVWIGEQVWIDNLAPVFIGNNVCISQGALLLAGSHDFTKTTFDFVANEIILEDGVWLGAKSVVPGGVVCRTHSILGAGSVAEKDLLQYLIYKGNPAIPILGRQITS